MVNRERLNDRVRFWSWTGQGRDRKIEEGPVEGQDHAYRIGELSMYLKVLGLFSPEKRRLRGGPTTVFQLLRVGSLFTGVHRTRGNWNTFLQGKFCPGARKISSIVKKKITHWNVFPREVVGVSSTEIFKTWLDRALDLRPCFYKEARHLQKSFPSLKFPVIQIVPSAACHAEMHYIFLLSVELPSVGGFFGRT